MKRFYKKYFAPMLFVLISAVSMAQGNFPPPPQPPPVGFPIDDNIIVLVVLGVLLGVYKIYKRSKALKA